MTSIYNKIKGKNFSLQGIYGSKKDAQIEKRRLIKEHTISQGRIIMVKGETIGKRRGYALYVYSILS